jgi:hypothetical protein
MSGWIKLHRSVKDHWIFKNESYLKAWISILIEVNHKDNVVLIDTDLVNCNRGQSLHSLSKWATIFGKGWSVQKVRTFFELLKKDSMIQTEGLRKTTRLTVCKYDSYQSEQQTTNTQLTDNQQTDNTQITTNKNEKNENKAIPTKEEFISHGLSKLSDVSIEALGLKYEAWISNDWCTNKAGKKVQIKNWKSTLTNTLVFLPKQPKQQNIDPLVERANKMIIDYGIK